MMNREECEKWLAKVKVLSEVEDGKMREDLEAVIGHPGLAVLMGLMLGARQAQYAALAHQPLGTAELSARASVIQGTIHGIELLSQTVLEQCPSARADNEGAR